MKVARIVRATDNLMMVMTILLILMVESIPLAILSSKRAKGKVIANSSSSINPSLSRIFK